MNKSELAEVLLWNELKGRKVMGFQFTRQKPIKKHIADFYCSRLKLVIEIDGYTHLDKVKTEKARQKEFESLGLRLLRFDDMEIKYNIENVKNSIIDWIIKNKKQPPKSLPV